ncbi:MAG: RluA family pseudouridine synthase [Saprospiraceae bacterium]|nr:RluA family pseudouridine synthase [Saprospiraceae bacterium]
MKKAIYQLLHEDDAVVIVNKSPGVLTIPDRFSPEKINLYNILKEKYGEIYVVHRLDKETSGVICFAKTAKVHKQLNRQFEKRNIQKKYHAFVEGNLYDQEGEIDAAIAPHSTIGGKMVIAKRGKKSVSRYKVLEEFKQFSFVEVDLVTGRTHQARIHMSHLGHPLIVDRMYGTKGQLFLSQIKKKRFNMKKFETERPILTRVPLHAAELSFIHPQTQERLTCKGEMPKDLRALLNQLRKWGK